MKLNRWMILLIFVFSAIALCSYLVACGDDDDAEEDEEPVDDGEELPLCTDIYPSAPAGEGTVELNGLEWTIFDNGEDINHNCAVNYAADMVYDGKDDWRLPTVAELSTLFDVNNQSPVPCKENLTIAIQEPFTLSCMVMWSSEESNGNTYKTYSYLWGDSSTTGSESFADYDQKGKLRALLVRDL